MTDSKFDALSLNTESAVRMPIVFPGHVDPLRDKVTMEEAYLELMSEDSEAGRTFQRMTGRDAQRRMRKSGARAFDDDDPVEFQINKVVALIVGWKLVAPDGSSIDVPFSKEAARDLLSRQDMGWLRRDAFLFAGDSANFTRSSSKI